MKTYEEHELICENDPFVMLNEVFNRLELPVAAVDSQGRWLFASKAFLSMCAQISGGHTHENSFFDDQKTAQNALTELLSHHARRAIAEGRNSVWRPIATGSPWVQFLPLDKTKPEHQCLLIYHKTQQELSLGIQKELLLTLQRRASTDALTGALNRHFLQDSLPWIVTQCIKRQLPTAVIMLDLDHFKRINDEYGHAVGDQVLVIVSRRMIRLLRADDHIVRYGGEEFIAVLPETTPSTAADIAERMRQKILRPMSVGTHTLRVTGSFGVVAIQATDTKMAWPNVEGIIRSALSEADQALYAAKAAGRNCVQTRT
ncbi:MAG: GGDEF domain-containing protein [Burkholderiales bacterium]|nr:GGDEF domain-containing protein [Burkholderiales bacterium]